MRPPAAALAALLLLGACSRQPVEVRGGDVVVLHWTALVDGKVYDTTEDGRPVEFALGRGALPPAVEAAIVGMRPGEEKTVSVERPYGEPGRDLQEVPAAAFAALGTLKPGMKVLGLRNGTPAQATVRRVSGGKVTLDFGHPLAGKTVGFRLRLVSVRRP